MSELLKTVVIPLLRGPRLPGGFEITGGFVLRALIMNVTVHESHCFHTKKTST